MEAPKGGNLASLFCCLPNEYIHFKVLTFLLFLVNEFRI